jgi:hypothetical protein
MRNFFAQQVEFPGRQSRILIIAAIIFFSLALGLGLEKIPLKWLIFGVGGILFILIALTDMTIALLLLLATSATVNFTISSGSSTAIPFSFPIVVVLIFAWIIKMIIVDRRIHFVATSVYKPFILFLMAAAFSWLWGYAIWDWRIQAPGNLLLVQAGQYALFFLSITAFFLIINHPLSEKTLIVWTLIIIVIGFATILPRLLGITIFQNDLVFGAMFMWPFLLLWGQLLFNPKLNIWMYVIGGGLSLLWAYWVYSQALPWKGGWVPAVLGLVLMLWFKDKRVFAGIIIIGSLLILLNWPYVNSELFQSEVSSASTIRPLFWWDVVRMTFRSPLFGLGPVNYRYYWQDPTFIPLSRIAYGWHVWDAWGYNPPSHNTFVDIFAQTGIIGFGLFLWGIVIALKTCFQVTRRLQPGFTKAYSYAVICGFISMCISSFVIADFLIPYVYNITITGFRHSVYSWLLLGSVIGLNQSLKEDEKSA